MGVQSIKLPPSTQRKEAAGAGKGNPISNLPVDIIKVKVKSAFKPTHTTNTVYSREEVAALYRGADKYLARPD